MKVLLTWYANPPDPYYWLWIRDLDGVVVKLSSMTHKQLEHMQLRGLKRTLGLESMLVVDSLMEPLGSGLVEKLQSWILYMQRLLGADVLVHRDYPVGFLDGNVEDREKFLRKTMLNAEMAVKLADKLGVEIMLVAQGWDLKSYTKCALHYSEIGARYIGVGSLVPKRSNRRFLVEVVSAIRRAVGSRAHVHVFGVMSPLAALELFKYVDSVDISTPIRAAVAREVFVEVNGRLRRIHVSLIGEKGLHELVSRVPELEKLAEKTLSSRELIRCLAIYNAYTIVDWVRRSIRC